MFTNCRDRAVTRCRYVKLDIPTASEVEVLLQSMTQIEDVLYNG